MMNRKQYAGLALGLASMVTVACANTASQASPFYVGAELGYGSTDWSMLVTNPNSISAASLPIGAKDRGMTWGFLMGYKLDPQFALEANYVHFEKSTVHFRYASDYWRNRLVDTYMPSSTSAYALSAKFIVPVSMIKHLSAFASAGLGVVHRSDELANTYRVGGVFGAGMNYGITPDVGLGCGFQFYTGYGSAKSLDPAYHYVPFLYQGYVDLTYHFKV